MDPTPTTDRLFALQPSPAERAEYRARNRSLALSMFDAEPTALELVKPCPACAGLPDACTCHRTGAAALELELGADTRTSAQRDEYRLTDEDEARIAERLAEVVATWRAQCYGAWRMTSDMPLTLERIAAHAIGCSTADLRASELEWIAGRALLALELET